VFQGQRRRAGRQAFNKQDVRAGTSTGKRSSKRAGSKLNMPEAPFAEGGFPTPSGKCEFYSAQMPADGLDPLPTYIAALRIGGQQSGTGAKNIRWR
jgi:hypothetical protein